MRWSGQCSERQSSTKTRSPYSAPWNSSLALLLDTRARRQLIASHRRWLPGAAIFRLPWLDRDRRAALDAEERAVLGGRAQRRAVAVGRARRSRRSTATAFDRLLIADVGVAAAAAAARRAAACGSGRRRARPGLDALSCPSRSSLLGAVAVLPAVGYIIGGKDPGVYMNEGIQIAQRGALVVPRSGRRGGAAVRARPVLSVASATGLLRARASWGSSSRTRTPARSSASFRTSSRRRSPSATASTA